MHLIFDSIPTPILKMIWFSGLANLVDCASFCAYPCCNSATTSTASSTVTSHTHTSTLTETTKTMSSTTSLSSSSTSETATETTITTTADPTSSRPASSTLGPAAVMRISMRVEVSDPQDFLEYFDDQAVREAYINVMSEVAAVPEDLVDLERTSAQLGYITMTYVITIPYTEGRPSIPLATVQEKLSSIDIPTFNELLDEEMREVAGCSLPAKSFVDVVPHELHVLQFTGAVLMIGHVWWCF